MKTLEDAILAEPDAWDAWLVYGDWLTEQGDARGELIRLEHRLHTQPMRPDVRAPLVEEAQRRRAAYEEAFFEGKGRVSGLRLHWRAGFVLAAELWTWWGDRKDLAFLEALAEAPVGRLFHRLRIHSHCGLDGIRTLAASPLLARTRALVMADIGMGGGTYNGVSARHGIDLLVGSPHLGELRSLDVSENDFSDGPSRYSSSSSSSSSSGAPAVPEVFSDDKGEVLGRLKGLSELRVRKCALGDAAIASLLGPAGLSGPTVLDLGANQLTAAAVVSIASAPGLSGLRALRLRDNELGVDGFAALAAARNLGALRALDLSFTLGRDPEDGDGDRAAAALARAGLPSVRELDLRGIGLSPAGLGSLTAAPGLQNCRILR